MKKNNPLPALVIVLLLTAGPISPQTPSPAPTPVQYSYGQLKENLTRYIHERMNTENIKGLSIALVDGPEIVWTEGFGYADAGKQIPATAGTRYALGGVSRIFTAAEVLHLHEKGRISLDRPIQKYIPGFSIQSRFPKTRPITPRALLGDHSGLPGFFLRGIWVDQPETLAELVEDLKSDYLYDPPQTHYRYSYTDYDLLGRLVELKRKKPFPDAVQEDLFGPLGMDSSAFGTPEPGGDTALGYFEGHPFPQSRLRDVPAGGMVSSAADLAKFLGFLLGGDPPGRAPLGRRSLEALFTPQYPGLPLDFSHETGMGWNLSGLTVEGAGDLAWCDGTYPGYFADVAVSRREGLGVAILSNSGEAGRIADDLVVRALKLALQVKKGIPADLEKKKINMSPVVEVPTETLEQYAGIYSALGQVTRIKRQDKNLGIEFQGHQLDLLPISQDTFVPHLTFILFPIDLPQYPMTFSSAGGKDVALLGGFHFPIPFERIAPVDILGAWNDRKGDYVLENPDGQMEFSRISLEQREDFLTVVMKVSLKALHIKDQEFKVAILPQSDGDAVVPGLFYGDGGTLHAVDGEDGQTRIFYSGYWFTKKAGPKPGAPIPVKPAPRPVASP